MDLEIINEKNFKKFKNWSCNIFNAFELFYTSFQKKTKLIKFSNFYATRRRSIKIIKKKKEKINLKNIMIEEFLELFIRFYEKFSKLTF